MTGTEKPAALTPDRLCAPIAASDFGFATTAELEESSGWLGQDRAVDAIRMAAEVPHDDFNLFVLGLPGSGRHAVVRTILTEAAAAKPRPQDWVYVNNFEAPHKPVAIALPPGGAAAFRTAMETLIDELANDIPAMFESDDYQSRRRSIEEEFSEAHETAMSKVFEQARARKVAILRTPMGFTFAGMRDGEVLSHEKYQKLSEAEQEELDDAIERTQEDLAETLKSIRTLEREQRRRIEALNYELAREGVDEAIRRVKGSVPDLDAVQTYLEEVRKDLIENAELFLMREDGAEAGAFPVATTKHYAKPQFQRYAVNVMVTHDEGAESGAPVVTEDLPTLANLIGRVEYASQMGALVTNFTMIKPGALHRANGGFLVLDTRQVLTEPFAWDALKRCLRSGSISIYSPGERLGLMSTVSLEPDPVPLDLRVILVGERLHYYLLAALDPDFRQLFKLEADFNDHIAAEGEALERYARMVADIARRAGTRALDAAAVAGLLCESSRLMEDAERLSLNVDDLSDMLREADFWAGKGGAEVIGPDEIEAAVEARERRAGRLRDLSHEAITRETVLIDTDGARVGQINALSVLQIGGFRFGRPTRLTARTRPGSGKFVDIERETELGGPIHSKGMLILQGYLAASYATGVPMSLWASLVFEQSYGGVDGDSASAAELIALLSSLAEAPVSQAFAITGSVNQFGDIQAIGGVNEKIEGFFDICAARGLTGDQGVLIPASNVKNLALRRRVIEAVEAGRFGILPMQRIEDGIGVLTGMEPGARGSGGAYPEGSFNRRVEDKLTAFAEIRKTFVREARQKGAQNDD
ncbi:peptidase [Maritimibacter sp. 55A14]|uniref:Lon protease family protein n=1 Tax=Maritimibacter sp. 55A14 TaxID=2174844 RepID=UPI000D6114C4|nr:ATP-binding protein [Maritimibacter sp. 55A14]PWE31403.1 peptidase [Maritimibacter sp. 55A14]